MESNLKNRTCYYFDVIMRVRNLSFHNILLDESSYENTLIYCISYKTFMGTK